MVQLYAPAVEASVIYGPAQYRGDWYISNVSGRITNGSCQVVNGSGQDYINGIPVDRNAPGSQGSMGMGRSNSYSGLFTPSDKNGRAFDDYKKLMGQYRPDMRFDNDGGVRLNGMKNNDDAGSSLVFKYLGKYVETDNFTVNVPHGNYTLYLRNGNSTGKTVKNGTIFYVRLNGNDIFTPLDYTLKNQVLKKKVSIAENNTLQVFAVGEPGSYMTIWLEDESPDIVITSPWDDSVTNGTILLAGYTADHNVKSVTIKRSNNNTPVSIPVTNGNFSTSLPVSTPVKLNITATDSTGTLRSTTLSLDGDQLPETAEKQYGFDPLKPDSDTKLTAANESGNGIQDGMEIFNSAAGEKLPVFIKSRIGADPFKVDTDNDGLADYFELVKMGLLTDVGSNDTDGNGISDAAGDRDNDSLSNLQEQSLGTDPLAADTDGDGLTDGYEVNISHTDPLSVDSDNDGLSDSSELKVGTDPKKGDSDGNGVLDSQETYTTTASNDTLGITVVVTGRGDMSLRTTIVPETSAYYMDNEALASSLADVTVNGSFDGAVVTMKYDPATVTDPTNYSLCYYNETLGMFLPVNSTVDTVNHTISARVTRQSLWGIFNLNMLADIYTGVANFNNEISGYISGTAGFVQNTISDALNPVTVTKTYTVNSTTNTVSINSVVTFNGVGAPTPTPTPTTGPMDYSPVLITMNNKGQTNWFGNGASFPAGVYRINATGWYTHWTPVPSEQACIDMGADRSVRMYAWSDRGNNYPYAGVSDHDRLGMHVKYGSSDSPVCAIRIEPGTLEFTSSSGKVGMWDNDDAYNDNTYQLSYTLSYVGQWAPSLDLTDTDSDGLPDYVENHGFMDTQGHVYYTDPDKNDTDGDSLNDGQEAGSMVTLNGMTYFQVKSSPILKDSDGDGLTDDKELQIGSLPFVTDTDHEGLTDGIDNDPLVPLAPQVLETEFGIARDIVLGAVFGQTGVEGGLCCSIVGVASTSVFYVVGWFVFSLVPIADTLTNIRDAAQCIANGDGVGAALYGSGILLSLVDAGAIATATGAVAIFIKLNPEKAAPLLRVLADVLKYLPDSVIEPTVRLFDKSGYVDNILECMQVSGDLWGDVLELLIKGGSLQDISTIVSKAKLVDAIALVDKGVSIADIARFAEKGQDLNIVGSLLDKGVSSILVQYHKQILSGMLRSSTLKNIV